MITPVEVHLATARALLKPTEGDLPEAVVRSVTWLARAGLWFGLSRNAPATSCRDAARKRWRLGHEGIELWNELKTFLGRFTEASGATRLFLAHCRGDRELDLERVGAALQAARPLVRLEGDELERLGVRYGLVNPFEPWNAADARPTAVQVFDEELLRPIGIPGTLMTNAGEATWAVEFEARALVAAIAGAVVADVSVPDGDAEPAVWGARTPRRIAIVTGNAPESGMVLWAEMNRCLREMMGEMCCGDVSMPEVTVRSLPALGMTMELDRREEQVWAHLRPEFEALCARGADCVAIACNTTLYFTPRLLEICARHGTELVSIPACVGAWLRARRVQRVALVGISFVADLDRWSAYRGALDGIHVERLGERATHRLEEIAYQVKTDGATESALMRLRNVLRDEVESRHVVLALTELSLLLDLQRRPGHGDRVLIDPLALCAEALACRYLGLPFPPAVDEIW